MWRGQGSGEGSMLVVHAGQRVWERGRVKGGLRGLSPEYLHAKTGEGVSNHIVCAWDVLCGYCKIMSGCKEEEAAEEGH